VQWVDLPVQFSDDDSLNDPAVIAFYSVSILSGAAHLSRRSTSPIGRRFLSTLFDVRRSVVPSLCSSAVSLCQCDFS